MRKIGILLLFVSFSVLADHPDRPTSLPATGDDLAVLRQNILKAQDQQVDRLEQRMREEFIQALAEAKKDMVREMLSDLLADKELRKELKKKISELE